VSSKWIEAYRRATRPNAGGEERPDRSRGIQMSGAGVSLYEFFDQGAAVAAGFNVSGDLPFRAGVQIVTGIPVQKMP
jgi:hypothetical protein